MTRGDLSRQVTVIAPGELGDLKDNINQMIDNLRATTTQNQAQDWLNSNLARISAMLQGQRNLHTVSRLIMSELTPLVGAHYGAFYMADPPADADEQGTRFTLVAGYGAQQRSRKPRVWELGEGLIGQAAVEGKPIVLQNAPGSVRIRSGSVDAEATFVIVLPILFEGRVLAVIELASFRAFTEVNRQLLAQIVETVGVVLNTISATTRTEELLVQSQELAQELQSQSAELQRQQDELQHTNAEIELARGELEERAEQLALSSRYKSEFLANMSHELRTPLNSLLILARMLTDNERKNLSEREIQFAQSIYEAGNDLLSLINDILDLSRVEAGKLEMALTQVSIESLCADLEQVFRPIAQEKALAFAIHRDHDVSATFVTDQQRVEQILKNLLSNACKFTEAGSVELRITMLQADSDQPRIAFSVYDTGIGIPPDKLQIIFEAFQQADGTTSRRYGGTGLGLSISREIAHLLGGEIQVESVSGSGSVFTLILPRDQELTSLPVMALPSMMPHRTIAHTALDESFDWSGTRVMIVDDDLRNLYALASALESRGIEVHCADNAQQSLKTLETTQGIDLVLMDIMMPEMDGYEAIREIRKIPGCQEIPIIAVTAKAMLGDREASLAAGASDYITKPVELDELHQLMRVWLDGD